MRRRVGWIPALRVGWTASVLAAALVIAACGSAVVASDGAEHGSATLLLEEAHAGELGTMPESEDAGILGNTALGIDDAIDGDRDGMPPPHVMVIHATIPVPDYKGADQRILTVVEAFVALGYRVTFLYYHLEFSERRHLDTLIALGSRGQVTTLGLFDRNMMSLTTYLSTNTIKAAVQFIWPDTCYMKWLADVNRMLRQQSPPSTVLVAVFDDAMAQRKVQERSKSSGHVFEAGQEEFSYEDEETAIVVKSQAHFLRNVDAVAW